MRVNSMTGFASSQGAASGYEWAWDIRSVNGKTLDIRARFPEWIEGLEPLVRKAISDAVARGNIAISLRVKKSDETAGLRVSQQGLQAAIDALLNVQKTASTAGLSLAPLTSFDLLNVRGVLDFSPSESSSTEKLRAQVLESLPDLLTEFTKMRRFEGAQLAEALTNQLLKIEALIEAAVIQAERDIPGRHRAFVTATQRLIGGADGLDPQRIAQELAILAMKSDATEEIDRLRAHLAAARALLADHGPIGRKFEFLTQEFLREANTLCAKSASTGLTAIGLDLKHVIDQMREQIQNVE